MREFHYFNIFGHSYFPVLSFRKQFVSVLIIIFCNVLGIGLINCDFMSYCNFIRVFIVNQQAD